MMWEEFEQLAGYHVSYDDYKNVIEPMYNATELSKFDFVKCLNKEAFSIESKRAKHLKEVKRMAQYIFDRCGQSSFVAVEKRVSVLCDMLTATYTNGTYFLKRSYGSYGRRDIYNGGCTFPDVLYIYSGNDIVQKIDLIKEQ